MTRTLAGRLILSHILPLVIVIVIIDLALNYVLQTRFLLTNVAGELTGQAVLVAELAADTPIIWEDPQRAQVFIQRTRLSLSAQVTLIDTGGILLASSREADASRLGQPVENLPQLDEVLAGEVVVNSRFQRGLENDIVDVFVPAWGSQNQVIGVIRLTQQLSNVYEQVLTLRHLIAIVLAVGLAGGVGLAFALSKNLGRTLRQVTEAVHSLANQEQPEPLPERGPTEILQLLSAVNRLVQRLAEVEENRRQLLHYLNHELGNSLTALRAATGALLSGAGKDPELRQELLLGMQGEEGRLNHLLADLAGLHDQVNGFVELKYSTVCPAHFLLEVARSWRELAQRKNLVWTEDVPDHLPPVTIDENRFGQVIGNLLSNAIKYTPPGGSVHLAAGANQREVWVRISDTGPGIPVQEQARIFAPFYRGALHAIETDGMGLGLSVAQGLVAAHGGRLEVSSQPGQGSHFTIWLPQADSPQAIWTNGAATLETRLKAGV